MKKKVLIMSQHFDRSTDIVLQWLNYYGASYIRVNHGDVLKVRKINIDKGNTEITIRHNSVEFSLSEITGFWYRRGNVGFAWDELKSNELALERAIGAVNKHLKGEISTLEEYFYFQLEQLTTSLGRRSNARNNKLIHLEMAKLCGLNIPDTIIVANKQDLSERIHGRTNITKAIRDGLSVGIKGKSDMWRYFSTYTSIANHEIIEQAEKEFFPFLLQQQIKKKYEIRVFYLNGELFSMAIFSQNDPQTVVDFRHYNYQRPNRMVPYVIDAETTDKIKRFMKIANLNTGSLDLICSDKDELFFLEVNPVGQFGMVSFPCNYYLEKKIAEYLIS
ncbi:ATP-GRASP peptide maturase, grasp-with-spasm system [Mucilaginibacter sp. OK268]|uniref:grasp-with-spasm system ATP-grasp peptide maturase n=1 Tax=Mucilaginibacter sp. OK268 TaxID=1881048 RepID=UPI00088DE52D|nr:grasp-with-spasm system ATP-grasp peptide maturase [Mucilaginibacter sp. OK268]SDP99132.1 ATP-GRASP peptide maturase, grasp-with-spasm system [Mucilaginibacter sp. OK268]